MGQSTDDSLPMNEVAGAIGAVTILSASVASGWIYLLSDWNDISNVPVVASVPLVLIGLIGGVVTAYLAYVR